MDTPRRGQSTSFLQCADVSCGLHLSQMWREDLHPKNTGFTTRVAPALERGPGGASFIRCLPGKESRDCRATFTRCTSADDKFASKSFFRPQHLKYCIANKVLEASTVSVKQEGRLC